MTVGLYAMQKIFLRFHHIPSEDLAKMVLANKKKSGLLHFEELEKIAQEIAEELLMADEVYDEGINLFRVKRNLSTSVTISLGKICLHCLI